VYLFAAIAANTFVAIFVPWYNPLPYLGQWSPNIWHNPTMAVLKPLAILGFWGSLITLGSPGFVRRWIPWLTSLCLFAGTLAKPSFIICFIPAVGVFLLIFGRKSLGMWRSAILLFLPSLSLLAWQFLRTYTRFAVPGIFQDKIVISYFAATGTYAPHVWFSSLLVLAFPLTVLVAIRKRLLRNMPLLVSFLLAFVGFLQGSFLAEENKPAYGNFVFGYIISLFMVYLFCLIEYLDWWHPEGKTKVSVAWKGVTSVVMAAHLISGFIYWRDLILGRYIF